jgi:RNA recognition motif-containing protein
MTHKIRVANLSYTTDGPSLGDLFAPYGVVRGAEILSDRAATSSSIGLGLVEMGSDEEGEAAIGALDGSLYCGRVLQVRWDVARAHRPPAGTETPA